MYIPGQHILGDIDLTQPTKTEVYTESDVNISNITPGQDDNIAHVTSKTETMQMKPEIKSTAKLKVPNNKMAVMMITPPPDIAGYKIVNEDGTEMKQDNTWHILHGNGKVFWVLSKSTL